ncbi:hypothetical protein BBF96_10760 [Anoxybacter fermentans]|uniref:Uncharacterized protein n=1 Tax=Anoxybacter fermentans TaxID=1323375 RepID=A0A3Q9HR11_9FIRM|nr:hypothetical protein [Anoxybacter fermentans]AZR73824.1 hypothetical protein BBF96_10760 [Anoxybacter fermentans]
MDVGDNIDLNDEKRLEDILASIGPDEKLILLMNRADAHEADDLIRILEEKGFIIQPKGGHEDDYYLHCWRRNKK